MTIQLKQVTWQEGRYSTDAAYVGKINIGGVSYTMQRNDPMSWYGRSALTGRTQGFAEKPEAMAFVVREAVRFAQLLAECVP